VRGCSATGDAGGACDAFKNYYAQPAGKNLGAASAAWLTHSSTNINQSNAQTPVSTACGGL